ncbi:glutamine synthetase family protein [Nocardioides bigeumensis]|uniref:Glutamine synthetase family protein n=1 Tax=Nocardioides bigeumensis TaxID=433657 RepID=A0ABP5JP70_9ACTN
MTEPVLDEAERESRRVHAEELVPGLADAGIVAVATSFVDNAGISRAKSVPLDRLPYLASWGVGFSPSFDFFRGDDWVAAPATGEGPVGDHRIVPDLDRLVVLGAQPGWAWAPGERWEQSGAAYAADSRLLLRRLVGSLAERGLSVRAAYEIEWVVSAGTGDEHAPATLGPAYGLTRLAELSDYCRDVLTTLAGQGVVVEQFHPEYAPGQLELSVAVEDPIGAADTSVLVRHTIRAVGLRHGLRTSFSPKVDAAGVGNGGHVHLSLSRDFRNLMSGDEQGLHGQTDEGQGFAAGILEHLPGLLALGAPSAASYLRLVPQHWAGAYACWGLENREAALRFVTGSAGQESSAANLEVKCVDLHANPYLLLAGLLVAGTAGLDSGARLPAPVDVDPASLGDDVLAERGVQRLPVDLRAALDAFLADEILTAGLGAALVTGIRAVRESEIERFDGVAPEDVAAASRWAH